MIELFGGIFGGLGIFAVGMWLLTENLKQLASRRLRRTAHRWTENRFTALVWGALGGAVTQSLSALTFIVVSILRSGLITTKGAFALILSGGAGVTLLVMIVTFDIKVASLYVLGIAGAVVISERMSKFRPIAASFFGGAMIILGLTLLKDAAAPLADQPWFRTMLEGAEDSLILAFLAAALLTALVHSSSAVSVFGISLATVGVVTIDQAIMIMYGSFIGSGASMYLLSANLRGRSRQVAMYMVYTNVFICAVAVLLFYCELYLDIPSMKALVLSLDLDLDQQLAFVYLIATFVPIPILFVGIGYSVKLCEALWPASQMDELSKTKFIYDHASVDVDTSVMVVDLEQKRVFIMLSRYFENVRQKTELKPLRDACVNVLSEIEHFLNDLHDFHPMQGIESRNTMMNRHKLLSWMEEAVATMCGGLSEISGRPALENFSVSIREGVDTVFLALADAMEAGDRESWDVAKQIASDRGTLMRETRLHYLTMDPPLQKIESINVLLVTNTVEEVFFLLSKLEAEFNPFSSEEEHVPHG